MYKHIRMLIRSRHIHSKWGEINSTVCSYLTWLKGRTEPSETKISAMWSLLKDTSSGSCRSRPNSTPRFTLWMVSVSKWNDLWLYSEKHQELGSVHVYYNAITDKNYNQVKQLIKNQLKIRTFGMSVWYVCLAFNSQQWSIPPSTQCALCILFQCGTWRLLRLERKTETGSPQCIHYLVVYLMWCVP